MASGRLAPLCPVRDQRGEACRNEERGVAPPRPSGTRDRLESADFGKLLPSHARNDLARAMVTRAALRQAAGDTTTARQLLDDASMIFRELGTRDEPARIEAAVAALDRGFPIRLLGNLHIQISALRG